ALAVLRGQLLGAGDEASNAGGRVVPAVHISLLALRQRSGGRASVVLDVLAGTASPRRETDAHDGADVGIRVGHQHALVDALLGLQSLGEEHALHQVDQSRALGGDGLQAVAGGRGLGVRDGGGPAAQLVPQAAPQTGAAALLVVLVEALALELARAVVDVQHLVHDLGDATVVDGDAGSLLRGLGLGADLAGQLQVQLILDRKSVV